MRFGQQVIILLSFLLSSAISTAMAEEPIQYSGMTEAHNKVRQKHDVPPLTWSKELATYAQEWADHLSAKNNCTMKHRPISGKFARIYGMNIFWASARQWSNGAVEVQSISAADVVYAWADEEKDYDYASNTCKAGEMCGHYTQIVWKNSTKVGCGMTVCPDSGQMWVCSYNPIGNYVGEKPY